MIYKLSILMFAVFMSTASAHARDCSRYADEEYATDFIIIAPAFKEVSAQEDLMGAFRTFLLEDVPLSSRVSLYAGSRNQLLFQCTLPSKRSFNSVQVRTRLFSSDFNAALKTVQSSGVVGQGWLNVPSSLLFAAQELQPGVETHVILLGPTEFKDQAYPHFSMEDGYVPNDEHLFVDVLVSPYGLRGRESLFDQIYVHFGLGETNVADARHVEALQRFWSLYINRGGGTAVMFSRDFDSALRSAARRNQRPLVNYGAPEQTGKLEMNRVVITPPDRIVRMLLLYSEKELIDEFDQSKRVRPTVEDATIAITWPCQECDLDLYVRVPGNQSNELFYENIKTSFGNFYKDFDPSNNPPTGFEYVEIKDVPNIYDVQIGVNFYSGKTPSPIEGALRVAIDGNIFIRQFKIEATEGNRGVDRDGNRASSQHWYQLSLSDMVPFSY